MLNDYGKSLFRPWFSVPNVCMAFALLYIGFLIIRTYNLSSSEIAGWVQAIGAIVSIWAAWSIAGSQLRRASLEARRLEIARCAGVIGILKHIESVVDFSFGRSNEIANAGAIRESMSTLVSTLDRIDLMGLPSAIFVDAICEVRQKLESMLMEFRDPLRAITFGMHLRHSHARPVLQEIKKHVSLCEAEVHRIRSDPVN